MPRVEDTTVCTIACLLPRTKDKMWTDFHYSYTKFTSRYSKTFDAIYKPSNEIYQNATSKLKKQQFPLDFVCTTLFVHGKYHYFFWFYKTHF